MKSPEFFHPEDVKPEIDPSLPSFKYNEEERRQLREKGVTDEEIDAKEALANINLQNKQIEEERKAA